MCSSRLPQASDSEGNPLYAAREAARRYFVAMADPKLNLRRIPRPIYALSLRLDGDSTEAVEEDWLVSAAFGDT